MDELLSQLPGSHECDGRACIADPAAVQSVVAGS
jgi:hypothetical protein